MKLRGYLTVGIIGTGLVLSDVVQRTVVSGLVRLLPGRRIAILTWWQRLMAHLVLVPVRFVGGAGITPLPTIPGEAGVLVIMNHQSLLDIPLLVASMRGAYPRIVTRSRYARGKPLISHMIRLYQYPVVDPRATVRTHVQGISEAARTSDVPMALYPEGTRTRDGSLGPWKTTGLRLILEERKWTVYLLVADGFWQAARMHDFMEGVSSIDGRVTTVGPLEGPDPGQDPEGHIASWRRQMEEALERLRAAAPVA